MSTPSTFVPTAPATSTATGSTIVPLANARFVLKGVFFDPVARADRPLPPHQFVLWQKGSWLRAVAGVPSEAATGIGWIPFGLDTDPLDAAEGEWALVWFPSFARADGSRQLELVEEVFLDLDANEWVRPAQVGHTDSRRLIRLRPWSSDWKSNNGGFVAVPPHTRFARTGTLQAKRGELKGFGSPTAPWLVSVDHGFFRNYVRYFFYDPSQKARVQLPPGLVVSALAKPVGARQLFVGNNRRVAAGTAIDAEGTVYLVHERTQKASKDVDYYFATGARGSSDHGSIDLTLAAKDRRVRGASRDTTDSVSERYLLPQQWCSHGMHAFTTDTVAGIAKREEFARLRLEGTSPTAPLSFHLDDAVLVRGPQDPIILPAHARVALFDHLLHLRDVDPKRPHLWKTTLDANYLAAENAIYVNGEGRERVTRLVYVEGTFHDVRERRCEVDDDGKIGLTHAVGARAVMANDHDATHQRVSYLKGDPHAPSFGSGNRRLEFHLLDPDWLDDFPDGAGGVVATRLMHLLVHVPLVVDTSRAGPKGEQQLYSALTHAAERWDQSHPGHPGQPALNTAPRTFGLTPEHGFAAGERVVRVRHYFGEATKEFEGVMSVRVFGNHGRASANTSSNVLELYLGDIDTMPSGDNADTEGLQSPDTTRITLAHEIGHVMGAPDEYWESYGLHPVPQWEQYKVEAASARPFSTDHASIMQSNNQPRLRHFWRYALAVSTESSFQVMLSGSRMRPSDPTIEGGPLLYALPTLGNFVLASEEFKGPYAPAGGPIGLDTNHLSELILYRLGDDEGTTRTMFSRADESVGALTAADRYDGLAYIVVNVSIQFPFYMTQHDRIRLLDSLDKALPQQVPTYIASQPRKAPNIPLHAPPFLHRIAICIEWRFGSLSVAAAPFGPLQLKIVNSRESVHPLLQSVTTMPLQILSEEIKTSALSILCLALGAPTFDIDHRNQARTLRKRLRSADFALLLQKTSALLLDQPSMSRVVKPV